eukprot:1159611-Pelagomonas_calceolata.AAC.6
MKCKCGNLFCKVLGHLLQLWSSSSSTKSRQNRTTSASGSPTYLQLPGHYNIYLGCKVTVD